MTRSRTAALQVVNNRRARAVPLRRRAATRCRTSGRRGAEGAGGRRALVRARRAQDRRAVRPLRRHAQPGLRRRRGREAVDDRRRRRDRGPGRALRGQGRDDVLLLDLRRAHGVDRGRLGARRSRRRTSSPSPDPYDAASPHHRWGPFAFTAAKLRSHFKVPGQLLDVKHDASTRRARRRGRRSSGRRARSSSPGEVVRTQLGLRSTWFRVGVLRLEPPARDRSTYGGASRRSRASPAARRDGWSRAARNGSVWRARGRPSARRRATGRSRSRVEAARVDRLPHHGRPDARRAARARGGRAAGRPAAGAAPTTLAGTVRPVVPGAPRRRPAPRRLDAGAPAATATLADERPLRGGARPRRPAPTARASPRVAGSSRASRRRCEVVTG